MNFGFSMVFLQFGLRGAGVQIVETRILLRGTVMKASSHEKHAKQQWKKQKKQKVQTHGQGLGRGLAGDMGLNFFFVWFFHCFLQFGQNLEKTQKKQKKNKKFRPMGKVWAIHTQTKKPKKQKTKKPKNQKTKKTKKNKIAHPKGRGSDAECWVLSFCFFCFCFLFFWFFGLCVDSHCRCAKQRLPGTVSGCTRSKVDTLQYSNVCYDIVHSANEQQRGMEFNFVRLRHMLLDLCTGNAAICALPWWPVLFLFGFMEDITWYNYSIHGVDRSSIYSYVSQAYIHHTVDELYFMGDNTTPMDPNTFRQGTKNPESYPKHCLRSYLSP